MDLTMAFLPVVSRPDREDPHGEREVRTMLSPHISSAFAEERQARYRHEAELQRLARTRKAGVRRAPPSARVATVDAKTPRRAPARCPSPAH